MIVASYGPRAQPEREPPFGAVTESRLAESSPVHNRVIGVLRPCQAT